MSGEASLPPRQYRGPAGLIVALAATTFLALGNGAALADNDQSAVKCGDTITADTELTTDLIDCPGDGIVIGADNIRLDLNGHKIDGDNVRPPCDPTTCETDIGVDNTSGHKAVTIEGGTVQEFEVGVATDGASGNRLRRLSSSNLDFGVFLNASNDSRVEKNSLSRNGISGVVLVDSTGDRIERNSLLGNGETAAFFFGSNDNRIEKNVFDEGNTEGIALHESSRNEIRGNSISHTTEDGVGIVDGSSGNRVEKNHLIDNGDGITLGGVDGNLISRNTITGTGFFGSPDTGGWAILLDGSDNSVVDRNTIEGGRGEAIFVTSLDPSSGTPDHNVVSRNDANSKLSDGIHVSGGATSTLIERNSADDNGDDGVDVDEPGTTLTHNSAEDNSDLGIEAVPGVIDGGHNRARGNGNPAQCTNVTCK